MKVALVFLFMIFAVFFFGALLLMFNGIGSLFCDERYNDETDENCSNDCL